MDYEIENSVVYQWIEVEFSNYCGMDCIICPNSNITEFSFISFENVQHIVELVKQGSYKEIMVAGVWDAFLHRDINMFMEYICTELPEVKLYFITKGQSLTESHLQKIADLKSRGYKISLTFSIFSLQKKTYNYMTGGDFFDIFMNILQKAHNLWVDYSLEFTLSVLTLHELEAFKKFADKLWKHFIISLIHNWWGRMSKSFHDKIFNEEKFRGYFVKRKKWNVCDIITHDYIYIDAFWKVSMCNIHQIDETVYLWQVWEHSLQYFLDEKKKKDHTIVCKDCDLPVVDTDELDDRFPQMWFKDRTWHARSL